MAITPPPTQGRFTIPPPTVPISDKNGQASTTWWRFWSSLFIATGSGTTINLGDIQSEIADLQSQAALLYQPSGPDQHHFATIAQARQFASWGM